MYESDFTQEEIGKLDQLYGTDFQDATQEDISLIIRWERYNTEKTVIAQSELNAQMAKAEADIEESRARVKLMEEQVRTERERQKAIREGKVEDGK